ncbi:hypothetical protein CK203_027698 [Vitis vinifera]|uniref:Uncharacterized protein n=2 Tax=Vitis vinifera TaxID=29760 RepID=A0A438IGZ1_VITVI|nr:hypothetical protein CK203_027698 [Vitis vinifera]
MVLRNLQPMIARHVVEVPFTDFGSLVFALYNVEDGISRGLWADSSPVDVKRKKPFGGKRSVDQYRPRAPSLSYDQAYMPPTLALPYHTAQGIERPFVSPRAQQTSAPFALRTQKQFLQLGPGHQIDHCIALRHAIQDLIDQGLVHLGQPSVTTNPLLAHTTHADELELELVVSDEVYEMGRVTLGPRMSIPFRLVQTPYADDVHTSDEEVKREDDEILRQLQSTQTCISVWSLLISSSTHRDALIQALSQIRVETTTTPEELIHMVMAGKATCIVFSNDDLPPKATTIALGYAPSNFGHSTQTIRAYDSTRRKVMGTMEIEPLIGPAIFVTLFQVIIVQSVGDMFIYVDPVLQISHSDDDLLLNGFTFNEVQTLEMKDFCRDFVAMSFDQHSSTVVLDMMRSMSYLSGMGLGRRQHKPSEFMTIPDHDVPFGLRFIPTEVDYRYMARLRKKRLSDRAPGTSTFALIAYSSPDCMSLMTLYFLDEINEHGTFSEIGDIMDGVVPRDEYVDEMLAMSMSQIEEMVQPELASPFDLFRVSVIKIAEEIQTASSLEFTKSAIVVDDLFDGLVGLLRERPTL